MSAEEDELRDLGRDVLWTEKGHFTMSGIWRTTHLVLGLTATIGSAVAAAVVSDAGNTTVATTAALLAAIASAVLTFLKPRDVADTYLQAGRRLGELRVKIRQCERLDLPGGAGSPELRAQLAEYAAEKAEIDSGAPHVPNFAMALVERRMKRGAFDETSGKPAGQ